jgi:hypothetical protein
MTDAEVLRCPHHENAYTLQGQRHSILTRLALLTAFRTPPPNTTQLKSDCGKAATRSGQGSFEGYEMCEQSFGATSKKSKIASLVLEWEVSVAYRLRAPNVVNIGRPIPG